MNDDPKHQSNKRASKVQKKVEKGFDQTFVNSIWSRLKSWLFTEHEGDDLRSQLEYALMRQSAAGDSFSEQERMMIANVLRFGAVRVEDVMVPRADIHAIDESAVLSDLLQEFVKVGHSRLPVYRGNLDDPTGMVHVKDLLSWMAADREMIEDGANKSGEARQLKVISGGKDQTNRATENTIMKAASIIKSGASDLSASDFSLPIKQTNIQRELLFVPPSMPVVNLLLRMQSTRVHLALVVDEYGGTDGLVSIEDLVEEVVGEIEDEHDEDQNEMITGQIQTGLIASARTPIDDLERELGIDLFKGVERDDDIETLGGLIFTLVGHVPVRGEIITHPSGLEFEILNADSRSIKALKISKKTA